MTTLISSGIVGGVKTGYTNEAEIVAKRTRTEFSLKGSQFALKETCGYTSIFTVMFSNTPEVSFDTCRDSDKSLKPCFGSDAVAVKYLLAKKILFLAVP